MSTGEHSGNSVHVTGGTFVGSSIGAGRVDNRADVRVRDVVNEGPDQAAVLRELRALLRTSHDQLVQAAGTQEEQVVVGYELRNLDEALDAETPQPEQVRSRWARISEILAAVTAGGTAVSETTTAVGELVRTLSGGS